jgi:cytochrome c oxidase subunit 3
MPTITSTETISVPRTLGGNGGAPPPRPRDEDRGGPPDYNTRLRRARLGLGVGITGIVMIFVSLASAYVVRQGLPTLDSRSGTLVRDWFPVQLPRLLIFNTFLLLISSVTMEQARRQVEKVFWLTVTLVLGLGFLSGQWLAWRELAARGFYLATSPSSSFIYLFTGLHGLHLLGGILALFAAAVTYALRRPMDSRRIVLDVTGWYWHFMALLWIGILCLLAFER